MSNTSIDFRKHQEEPRMLKIMDPGPTLPWRAPGKPSCTSPNAKNLNLGAKSKLLRLGLNLIEGPFKKLGISKQLNLHLNAFCLTGDPICQCSSWCAFPRSSPRSTLLRTCVVSQGGVGKRCAKAPKRFKDSFLVIYSFWIHVSSIKHSNIIIIMEPFGQEQQMRHKLCIFKDSDNLLDAWNRCTSGSSRSKSGLWTWVGRWNLKHAQLPKPESPHCFEN